MSAGRGMVFLVGAGPGDEGLITVRGLELIRRADAIVYDRLVGEGLLAHRRPGCECFYAGKSPAGHTMRQDEINDLLVRLAAQGRMVVRLKGGDPFVFGRGGEEALALIERGIPFEVVPGVTSAVAGPAAAGIPVTHRAVSTHVTIVTGHEDPDKGESQVEWERLAAAGGTLVVLMGLGNLPEITQRLMAGGRDPGTAVAIIRHATTSAQEVLTSTLERVAAQVHRRGILPPAVIVVGDVVRLRDRLTSGRTPPKVTARPLAGRRVLVTRAVEQAGELADLLRDAGAQPIVFPLIRIAPAGDARPLTDALRKLSEFDWLIFTSANAVRVTAPHLEQAGLSPAAVAERPRVAAVGPTTGRVAREAGFNVAFVPARYAVESLVDEFPEPVEGRRVLILRARDANPVLPRELARRGARVEEVCVYGVEPVETGGESLRRLMTTSGVDVVTLTSSSAVRSLAGLLGADAPSLFRGVRAACLGHVTAGTFQETIGREPDIRAHAYTMRGLVDAIIAHEERGAP